MTPERLGQIEDLYHAARQKDAAARAAFLAEACAGDDTLRQEVESLLEQPTEFGVATNVSGAGPARSPEDLSGKQLGQYKVLAPLGHGGMAKVYKGYQESVDRFVAIKVLPRHLMTDPSFLERFKQEARIVAKLQHPHILTVFDHGEGEGFTYLAMPLIESGTLSDVLRRGRLSFHDTARIMTHVCEALDYAHAQGIVHRDIKPSNILIDPQGNAFVADFGIAKILGSAGHLTQTGLFIGSPNYMSPEQMMGSNVGPQSDLYSVGLVLYEMLTGAVPFKADSALGTLSKHLSEALPSPREKNPEVTAEIEAVVAKALTRSRDDRYSSGRSMALALSAAVRAFEAQHTKTSGLAAAQSLARSQGGAPSANDITATELSPAVRVEATTPPAGPTLVVPQKDASSHDQPRRAPRVAWAAGALGMVSVAILALWMIRTGGSVPQSPAPPPDAVAVTALPQPASVGPPANQEPARGGPPALGAAASSTPSAAPTGQARQGGSSQPAAGSSPAAGGAPAAARDETLTAKQMYVSRAPGEPVNPGLKFRLIESRGANGDVDADPAKTFHSGDRVRFAFASNIDGFLYVVQRGSSGQWTVLFPDPEANGGRNAIRRAEDYFVPNNGWFAFDDTPGTEEVFVLLSKQPLEMLPGFDAPVNRREKVEPAIVASLQRSIQSRDLVFEKDAPAMVGGRTSQATYVVNRAELAGRVQAFIPLTHAK